MHGIVLMLAMVHLGAPSPEEQAVAAAKRTLVATLNLADEEIEVREVAPAAWRGPGVGCQTAREGDPTVEGYRIVLAVAPNVYLLHAAGGEAVVCGLNPTPAADALPEPANPRDRKLVDAARRDLVGRLGRDAEIVLVDVAHVTWPDSSVGCPKPDMSYMQVLTPGVRIRFRVGPRVYQYHAGGGGAPFLCDRPEAVEPLPDR